MEAIARKNHNTSSWGVSYQVSQEAKAYARKQGLNPNSTRGLEIGEAFDKAREDGRQNEYNPGTSSFWPLKVYNDGFVLGRQEVEQA